MTTGRQSLMSLEEIYASSTVDAVSGQYAAIANALAHPAAPATGGTTLATSTTTTPSTITNPVRPLLDTAIQVLPATLQPYAPIIYGGAGVIVLLLLMNNHGRRRR